MSTKVECNEEEIRELGRVLLFLLNHPGEAAGVVMVDRESGEQLKFKVMAMRGEEVGHAKH